MYDFLFIGNIVVVLDNIDGVSNRSFACIYAILLDDAAGKLESFAYFLNVQFVRVQFKM